MRRRELLGKGLAAVAAPFVQTRAKSARKTNVVMFMTDDHGAWATGTYGCRDMHTPNIDALAAGGAKFTRAFSCTPVCSPSRMTFMTGSLPSIHGVQDWLLPEDSFGPSSPRWLEGHLTYTEVLQRNGYKLGMFGKWHMGHDDEAQAGFTEWATVPGGGGPYLDQEFVHSGERKRIVGFKTDVATDFALEFLEQQKGGHQPFYMLVPSYAPHTPYDYQPEQDRAWFKDSEFPCFPNLPPSPHENPGLLNLFGKRESKLGYSALIAGVDRNVGRVLAKLEELGLREDTLVIFTADQGWSAGHHGVWGKGNGTIPFNMFEEAIQVPLIWNLPGRIAAGQRLTPMVSSYDYFPTILEYLGMRAPVDRRLVGQSYAGFLRGKTPAWTNRLYFEYAHARGIRTETLKYLERAEGWPAELYDLEADPGETRNLLDDPAYGKQRDALKRELKEYFQKAGAPPLEEWRSTTKQHLPSESATKGPDSAKH